MRIMVIGSIPSHVPGINQEVLPQHELLFDAAKNLGRAISKAGHRIIIGSTSPRTVDAYIINGATDFCRQHPEKSVHIEIHRPQGEPETIPQDIPNLHLLPHTHHADPSSPHKWIVAHARAAEEADIIITMAGATSTRLVGHLAMDKGKPIIPIPCFGGTSEDLFEFFRYRYGKIKVDDKPVDALLGSWRNGTDEQVVKIAEILFKKHQTQSSHTYFISYSWKDCVSADHIETLLRREHRPILRDEADIQAGEPISNRVHALIEVCDTFIALWSSQYSQSQWCTAELEYAAKLLHTKKIKRVILLNLDNHPLSLLQANQLSEPATTRRDRELAILKMTRDEVS